MSTTPEPSDDPWLNPAIKVVTFESDGQLGVPAGQYLVHVWPDGKAELAWRESVSRTWSPPVRPEFVL